VECEWGVAKDSVTFLGVFWFIFQLSHARLQRAIVGTHPQRRYHPQARLPTMSEELQTANRIRAHLDEVAHLRTHIREPRLIAAIAEVKLLQSLRFRATYADFLRSPIHVAATRFFLEELYGKIDFTERDIQFGRIAGAIERLFPVTVGDLAVNLAEIHALSERLDHEMAEHWLSSGGVNGEVSAAERYVRSWRATGQREHRHRQLAVVLQMGHELQRLTQIKSLLIGLKMMRKPAHLAGLSSLQMLLERGFAAFAAMGDAKSFLSAIECRESAWIAGMFDTDLEICAQQLTEDIFKVQIGR
jgi:hypothetical protein